MSIEEAEPKAKPLRILLLEDSEIDAELIATHLEAGLKGIAIEQVSTRDTFKAALERGPDIILADYSLPSFSGLEALKLAQSLKSDIPFIFVSGVVGEEFATSALQNGAADYITKRNLRRLPFAVTRAVTQAQERRDRRLAEAALVASEIGSSLAMAAAKLGRWSLDLRTNRFVWDARCAELLGAGRVLTGSEDEFAALVHEDDRDCVIRSIAQAVEGATPSGLLQQFRIVQSGREHWVEWRGQAVLENNAPTRLVGIMRDVTDEKRAEQAMLKRTASLEASVEERTQERDQIWNYSHDLLAIADLDGHLRTINPAWTELLGHSEDALLRLPLQNFVHPEDADTFTMSEQVEGQMLAPRRFENRLRRTDGTYRWFSWTAVPFDRTFYAIGRDITEEKAAGIELAEANRLLREQIAERERAEKALQQLQRLEAVGQLTSGVAHDFNNLLTVILGNLGFVERALPDGSVDPKIKRRLGHMRVAADRGATLTAQLLAFARRQSLKPRALDLNETVEGMRELLQTTIGGSVALETRLSSGLWPALVDPTQIEMIILNLAINARDAMSVGGHLIIETRNVSLEVADADLRPGEYVQLTVSDTGTGMTEEVLARAMEPFFTTKEVGKGSGLGLAQVYGFAKQSGGGVKIRTAVGEGTSISVMFPRADKLEEAAAARTPAALNGPEMAHETILLVDDDEAVRDVTASMLREKGYNVIEAGSGSEALTIMDERDGFDLMLVDYAMPGMNGGDFVRAARKSHPGLPAIFLTGYADLNDLQTFAGDRVVQKPFKPEELLRQFDSILHARH
jgi:PAS domain S-box-containing protein